MKKAPVDRRLDVILNGFECSTVGGKVKGDEKIHGEKEPARMPALPIRDE
jgi:hypothetical protein